MPEKEKMYRQTAFHSFRLGWWYLAVQIRRTQSTAKKATVAASIRSSSGPQVASASSKV